ncbi:MAG: histidine phosphatase family protein [Caulobacteraceae bacterium]|nr:histidine phosphatase family protein [Caulobacteraceae bacterium]
MSVDAISAEDQIAASPPTQPAAARAGAIVLARHGEPNLSRKIKLSAAGYAAWWARYEAVGLLPGQTAPAGLVAFGRQAAVILSSTRPRAIETAKAVAGDRAFLIEPQLVEAPLPPPRWPDWFRLSPRLWGVTSRTFWWFFNHHDGQESRKAAQARADAAADRLALLAAEGDVLVVAHGFFNTMVGRSLRRHGWKLKASQGYKYWAMRRFERGGPATPAGPELAAAVLES